MISEYRATGKPNGWVVRGDRGQFQRKHRQWSLENFDDGYVDADGRIRVFYPKHPRAKSGYILRSLVAWEYYNGKKIPRGFDVHHKNKNRQDDSKENLELIEHAQHTKLHFVKPRFEKICHECKFSFFLPKWRAVDSRRGKFCSMKCRRINKNESKKRRDIK